MDVLLLVGLSGLALVIAYCTYGRWLSRCIFRLDDSIVTPAHSERDDRDYCPTRRSIVFGHHFTSIAGTGPIVGPAIAVMWGWLPAILWVVIGSIFVGAVHDFGSLVVSMRAKGRSIGDVAGDLLGPRARLIFLSILIVGLWIVLAIFGLVIAAVLKQYPQSITPVLLQIPLAILIGVVAHRAGRNIALPSVAALVVMYLTVIFGDIPLVHGFNQALAAQPIAAWVVGLLVYAYIASVIPVWVLLQPRDYINALQLLSGLAVLLAGVGVASLIGGAPSGDEVRPPVELVAPVVDWQPKGAPPLIPVLFITIACGACSGFHCLVGSGTTSKQIERETDARTVGYGSMLTEGFLATLVIAACAAGIGLSSIEAYGPTFPGGLETILEDAPGVDERSRMEIGGTQVEFRRHGQSHWELTYELAADDGEWHLDATSDRLPLAVLSPRGRIEVTGLYAGPEFAGPIWRLDGQFAFAETYKSWSAAGGLASTVGAFVNGSANFIAALGIPLSWATALMAVMVASFAATTMDTACRLQRYVIQELAWTFLPRRERAGCRKCNYDLSAHIGDDEREAQREVTCPECGAAHPAHEVYHHDRDASYASASWFNPFKWLSTIHGATLFAVVTAFALAMLPQTWDVFGAAGPWAWLQSTWTNGGRGALILWPLFGATNQLLAGFAFLVIGAWLARRGSPRWFIVIPTIFMLLVPASALVWQAFIGNEANPSWLADERWLLVGVAAVTLVLEAWLVVEVAVRMAAARRTQAAT